MSQGVQVVGLYVRDHDEALAFYVEKLGFKVHTDVRNGDYRWLTVQHPEQPSFQLGLFVPGPPVLDAATAHPLVARAAFAEAKSFESKDDRRGEVVVDLSAFDLAGGDIGLFVDASADVLILG